MKSSAFYVFAIIAIGALLWLTFKPGMPDMDNNEVISTDSAPAPIGPYSQAVMRNNALFVSGQIAIDPSTNTLDTANITVETKRVMENISAILRKAKMQMTDIVKTTIYLTDLENFTAVNEVYGSYFGAGPYPARETVQVAALPKGVHIEISVTAVR